MSLVGRLTPLLSFVLAGISGAPVADLAPSLGGECPVRVLFVGNSFTFGNDLPQLVAELGLLHDPTVRLEVGTAARDGMTLERHWKEGDVARRLTVEAWDIVVLQEQSARPVTDPELMELYVRRFAALAREAGTEVILFQTWARLDEPETEQSRAATYRQIAEAVGATVASVGAAWSRALARRPKPRLHAADGLHASPAGSRLAASEILKAILCLDVRPAKYQRQSRSSAPQAPQAVPGALSTYGALQPRCLTRACSRRAEPSRTPLGRLLADDD